ncbi:hypothetical protein I6B53_00815 [Schaalia sp. 19OD2882]|uniref:hypothetical protein n=1 Tax=Schaalia sp. 19OD2882 TaxID=2794089 RepID=UPI001C1EF7E3|nr:hypothetical protein [Schaalia sp. 19OD2882]QWW19717.1 hypothetical protein I6B53_00815 [Schaalia sp. 19OD2882]
MTIDALADPPLDVLARAAQDPRVHAAFDEVAAACVRLRFHEGLRRGWQEARAEAAVREAAALSLVEGARTSVDDLRAMTMDQEGRPRDPASSLAVGIWRAQWGLACSMAPLNTRTPTRAMRRPLPWLVAGVHRDVCSALVEDGHLPTDRVAIAADPAHLAAAMRILGAPLPATATAAALVAHFRFRQVFAPGSAVVGSSLARWVLVDRGVDPTGVLVPTVADATDPATASRELAGWVGGGVEGVARWYLHVCRTLLMGVREGEDVALHVQAGSLG